MSTKIAELIVTTTNLLQGLDLALKDYQVAALTQKGERFLYDYVTSSREIELKCQPTGLPPKKFFFPQDETILEYTESGEVKTKIEAKPTVIFGLRPCDINGLRIITEAFADDHGDPNYLAKSDKAIVIGVDCGDICHEDAFCFKVQTHNANSGYDIMLYPAGADFAIEVASAKGKAFIEKYFTTSQAKGNEIELFQQQKDASFGNEKPFKNLENFPELFEQNKHHEIWDQEGARCLSCGSCIMVCPTCYCFDVKDEWDLDLKKGQRVRKWDACMLSAFATISSGENFRNTAVNRLRHRINRKFNYLMKKHQMAVCVGCGRCVRACLVDISPKTIAEAINGEKKAEGTL